MFVTPKRLGRGRRYSLSQTSAWIALNSTDSEGRYQAASYNDDFDGGRDSRVTFTPSEGGTYYARVSGDRDETGSYTLSLTDVTLQ